MKKTFIFVGLVLIIAIGFQFFGLASKRKNLEAKTVGEFIPREIPGWTVEDKPVADSPEMQKVVNQVLNYDDAVFRIYRKGGKEISVYVAYWLPGKIHPTGIDAHTPDVCWVANGWEMQKMSALASQREGADEIAVPNYRKFKVGAQSLSVVYWHFNGVKLRQSDSVRVSKLSFESTVMRRVKQIYGDIVAPAEQQVFMRISSNGDISSEFDELPVKSCLQFLARVQGGDLLYENSAK